MSNDFDPDWPHGHTTREGEKPVAVFRYEDKAVVAVFDREGSLISRVYYANGRWRADSVDCGLDLINAPAPKRKLEAWVNFYESGFVSSCGHLTKEAADAAAEASITPRIACLHVTGEEGDGL